MNCEILKIKEVGSRWSSEIVLGEAVVGRVVMRNGAYVASVNGNVGHGASKREAAVNAVVKAEWCAIGSVVMEAARKMAAEDALFFAGRKAA